MKKYTEGEWKVVTTTLDMYKALKHTEIVLENLLVTHGRLDQQQELLRIEVRQAIAKAEGRTA